MTKQTHIFPKCDSYYWFISALLLQLGENLKSPSTFKNISSWKPLILDKDKFSNVSLNNPLLTRCVLRRGEKTHLGQMIHPSEISQWRKEAWLRAVNASSESALPKDQRSSNPICSLPLEKKLWPVGLLVSKRQCSLWTQIRSPFCEHLMNTNSASGGDLISFRLHHVYNFKSAFI